MDLDDLKNFLQGGNAESLLPSAAQVVETLELTLRILMMAGPVLMVIMGLVYLFAAPKEANYKLGFRCYFGMGSVEAWQFTQRLAGSVWAVLGVILMIAAQVVYRQFPALELMERMWCAVVCVLWQAGLLLLASLIIRIVAACRFDRHGVRRAEKRQKQ